MFGMQMGKMGGVGQMTLAQRIAYMFANSEPGAWYDPSDMSTLFQDSAGTTPVTAMEQPVGLILDKSTGLVLGPELVVSQDLTTWASEGAFGNWGPSTATASVLTSTGASGSRHVKFACTPGTTITASAMGSMAGIATGARLAIVFGTSGNAYISVVSATTTSTSPTQLRVIGTAPSNAAFCEIVVRADGASGSQATFTDVSAKELPGNHASQATSTKRSTYSRRVNWLLATATLATQSITTQAAAYTLAFSGAGSVTLSGTATGVYGAGTHAITCTAGSLTLTVSGAVTDARCVLSIDAHLPYQWVNTATDYDADPAKFPAYLKFDGVDDAMQTANIDFTGTDKMTVWAGVNVNNLGDAGGHTVVMLKDNGFNAFIMFAPTTLANAISFGATGNSASAASIETGLTASNFSAVLTGIADLAGNPASVLRRNSQQVAASSAATGGGMFSNAPLYVGAQNTGIRFFNGRLYSLIVRGAQTPLSQIEATERYIKQKMRLP